MKLNALKLTFLTMGVLAINTSFADADSWNSYCNDNPYSRGYPCFENPSCGDAYPGAYVLVPDDAVAVPGQVDEVNVTNENNLDNTQVDTNNYQHSNDNTFNGGNVGGYHGGGGGRR